MAFSGKLLRFSVVLLISCTLLAAADFTWNWHEQQVIGRTDSSLKNSSKLTEAERAALMEAVVTRLQKPLAERGYDDERIREIASTTRLRFVELGGGKPLILATSLGLEGGCDELVNCPFWIFRKTAEGYVSLVDTVAASYTVQPTRTNGYSDLVISRHESASRSKLMELQFEDGKYAEAGCYTATFPESKEGEVEGPEIA